MGFLTGLSISLHCLLLGASMLLSFNVDLIEELVVSLETFHEANIVNVVVLCLHHPLFDPSKPAFEGSFLHDHKVCGALRQSSTN